MLLLPTLPLMSLLPAPRSLVFFISVANQPTSLRAYVLTCASPVSLKPIILNYYYYYY